jgi:cell division protein FtsW
MFGQIKNHPDYILLITTIILIILGILILASASIHISPHLLERQILFGLLPGLILAFLAFKINLDFLKKISSILLFINLILLGMVFIPGIGVEAWGATRWIDIGPISFQPSEFLKITFILYLANWLSVKRGVGETLIAFLIIIGLISLFLIFQPNLSTLIIITFIALLIYFLANTPIWHTGLILLMSLGSLIVLIKIAPYRLERLIVYLNPGIDPMGIGFQIQQVLIAIGSGGVWGTGLGMSIQKFGFLPGAIADSIFAVFAEEAGFIGSIILISLFLIFLWRGFRIAKLSQDKFSQLTAYGITSWITIQAFVNIGSIIGVLPLTGIPLPFISHGGTALITTLIGVGILFNISRYIKII